MSFTKRFLAPAAVTVALCFTGAACGGSSGSSASFCDSLKKWQAQEDTFEDAGMPGSDEFDKAAAQAKEALAEFENAAPAEIKGDVQTLAKAMTAFADLDTSDPAAMATALEDIDQDAVEQASKNITDFAEKECDVDLDAD